MNTQASTKITLEEITRRKAELLLKIHAQEKAMKSTAHEIFAPITPAANKTNAIMRSFNTGMAIFDGVMIGIKMMRKIRKYFSSPSS